MRFETELRSSQELQSPEPLALLNPRMPDEAQTFAQRILLEGIRARSELGAHVFVLTSGTTSESYLGLKWVALSKQAILNAAEASNAHLHCKPSRETWLHTLPGFHIGGLSIWARSLIGGDRVIRSRCTHGWDPYIFTEEMTATQATLCSLVPAQVHDLIQTGCRAPCSVRAILLGGGSSSPALVWKARRLGWPVLPTYGMSEASSQVATAPLASLEKIPGSIDEIKNDFQILPHLDVRPQLDQRLRISGSSLLSGYILASQKHSVQAQGVFYDPKDNGWFQTEDYGHVSGPESRILTLLGRTSDRIKIGGETVHLGRLEEILSEELTSIGSSSGACLIVIPDPRLESVIHIAFEKTLDREALNRVVENYNRRVLPFERIRSFRPVLQIPRTELGKIKRAELLSLLEGPESSRSSD